MLARFAGLSILAAIGLVGENACAMNGPAFSSERCRVIGGEKLPAEAGSAEEICAAILAAADSRGAGTSYSVEVRVLSPSSMAARIRLQDGRTLPEQKMAVSDRELNPSSIDRFAAAIADAVRKSGKP